MMRLAALLPLLLAGPALAASPTDADWPCVQRKVPELSAAAVWTGPAVETAAQTTDEAVTALVERIASRRTPVEEAEQAIADFAATLPAGEREAKLTAVFAGLFERLNRERADVMAGIERYARKQRALADAIRQESASLAALRGSGDGSGEAAALAEREDKLAWDTRIFNERQASLTYVCEVPTLIEQRLGRLARAIEKGLGGS